MKAELLRWRVRADEGYKKRKDRRVVRAATATKAMALAKKARGWGAKKSLTITLLD